MGVEVPSSYDVALDVANLPGITIDRVGSVGPVSVTGIPTDYSVTVRLAEIPSVRGHIPASYQVGLSVFGVEVLSVRLCGETQVITEPFEPNPCERCGPARPPRELAQGAAATIRIQEP
ncbi:MAG: hypothetical protein ACRDHY_14265 [Anaerolineales bacterium]